MQTANKSRSILAAALLLAPALALADGGIYLGAGVGRANLRDENVPGGGAVFDAKSTAYKGFLGYRFGGLPLVDLAAEAAYTDFGAPTEDTGARSLQYKLKGASVAGLAILPLGPIDLYGKGGMLSWNLDRMVNGATQTNKGTSPFYGAGLGFKLFGLGVRAEYEYYKVKNIDSVQMLSVSALYQF
jgi:hypothetical protein